MSPPLAPDQRLARLAARHHGLITRSDALRGGLTDRQISTRLVNGRWLRVDAGVYRIAGAPVTEVQRAYAAVLAAGHDALLAGTSALALLGVGRPPLQPFVTRPPSASGRTSGVRVRRSPVEPQDRTLVGPVPCTTPARALLEASATVRGPFLEALVDEVLDRQLATPASILSAIRRAPVGRGRAGATQLRIALRPWLTGICPGSPAEARLIRRLGDWGAPPPVLQHEVVLSSGRRAFIDIAWPAALVGLEYDGSAPHGPRRLGADVQREEDLRSLGWWIGRVDRHDLAPSSVRVRDELAARLPHQAA